MTQPARLDEDKVARRAAILAAARGLFLENSRELPSAARIADAAGLAKGTVYLYFRTKEEIFAALLGQDFADMFDSVERAFADDAPGSDEGTAEGIPQSGRVATVAPQRDAAKPIGSATSAPDTRVRRFIDDFIAYHDHRPEMLRLDAMSYNVLERNVGPAQLRDYKLRLMQHLMRAGARVDAALGLPAGRGATLLMRSYALARGLWQLLDHPPALREAIAEPMFAPVRPEFRGELREALADFWRGALAPG